MVMFKCTSEGWQLPASRVLRYSGNTTRTSTPRRASASGNEPATSPRPPVLANPTASDAANNTRNGRLVITLLIPSPSREQLCGLAILPRNPSAASPWRLDRPLAGVLAGGRSAEYKRLYRY